jgi:hypothetical protein
LIWPPALSHLVEARGMLGTTFQFGDHWVVLQRAMLQ